MHNLSKHSNRDGIVYHILLSSTRTFPVVAPPVNVAVKGTSSPHCANAALIPSAMPRTVSAVRLQSGNDVRSQRPFEMLIVSPLFTGVIEN